MGMGKRASKAPKERINIVYRPAASPNEQIELPFKILVMANLKGEPEDTDLDDRKPISIDQDNFNEVMRDLDLGVSVAVKDKLTNDPDSTLQASVKFKKMRDFSPAGVAQQVPELKKLLELREALSALKSPLGNKKEFRQRIRAILDSPTERQKLLDELGIDDDSQNK